MLFITFQFVCGNKSVVKLHKSNTALTVPAREQYVHHSWLLSLGDCYESK